MLPSQRQKRLQLLYRFRNNVDVVREVEAYCHASSHDPVGYDELILRAAFNLKIRPDLNEEVLTSSDDFVIEGSEVGKIDKLRKLKEKRFEQMLQEKYDAIDDQQFTSIIKCRKCGSDDVRWDEKQTRSADEGATVFCTCNKCFNRWTVR